MSPIARYICLFVYYLPYNSPLCISWCVVHFVCVLPWWFWPLSIWHRVFSYFGRIIVYGQYIGTDNHMRMVGCKKYIWCDVSLQFLYETVFTRMAGENGPLLDEWWTMCFVIFCICIFAWYKFVALHIYTSISITYYLLHSFEIHHETMENCFIILSIWILDIQSGTKPNPKTYHW